MKGLLLCGENDPKLLPVTSSTPKQLLPVANIPICEHIIKNMVQSGIRSIGIVTGDNRSSFSSYFKDGRAYSCRIKYIDQPKPLGTAHALLCAKEFLDGEDFVLALGDVYFEDSLSEYIQSFKKNRYDALILTKQVDNPWEFGVVSVKDERIIRIVEKPAVTASDLAATGVYIFRHPILKAASRIKPSTQDGGYGISNAIQYLIDREYKLSYKEISGQWWDIGKYKYFIKCNMYAAGRCEDKHIIGENTELKNSSIDDGVCIGSRCSIIDSSINNSVVLNDCVINGVELYDSIVGNGCHITGKGRVTGIFGDNTKTYINMI